MGDRAVGVRPPISSVVKKHCDEKFTIPLTNASSTKDWLITLIAVEYIDFKVGSIELRVETNCFVI